MGFFLFLASILMVASFGFVRTFAEAVPFKITNVKVTQISATASGGITGFDDKNVRNNVVFRKVGDSVTYRITIKNVSETARVVDNISSDYEGELFDYSFNSYAGDEIAAGDSFDFLLKTSYKKSVNNVNERNQDLEIKIIFKFTDGTEMSFTIANPSTWDNISVFGVVLAVSVIGLLVLIIFRMKHIGNDKKVVITAILLAVACLPLPFVNAVAGEYDVMIDNSIVLRDQLIIDYRNENNEKIVSATVDYDEVATPLDMPERVGYTFDGWETSNKELYDFSRPMKDDVTLYARYTPINYSVEYYGNGATGGVMAAETMTYDAAKTLTKNAFARAGYDFAGWNLSADGSGQSFADEAEVNNLCDNVCIVKMFAIWQARNDTHYTVVDKFMNVAGDGYDSIERLPIMTVGTTDTDVTPLPLVRDGFVTPEPQTKRIAGDGSMRIEYEYVRVQKQLTIQNAQYVTSSHASGKYNYGTVVTLKAKDRDEYIFDKWSNGSTEKEITVTLNEDVTIGPEYRATDFPLVYSHDGACTFNGIKSSGDGTHGALEAGNITGENCTEYADQKYIDTGVQLYTETNAHKDFYIEFTIDEFDLSKNASRATMLNVTQERDTAQYPGVVVRRNDAKDEIVVGVNVVRDGVKKVNFKKTIKPASSVTRVRLVRKNDIICYAINDDDYAYAGDNTLYNQYFEMPNVMFGATINEQGVTNPRVERYLNGTLSGMKVRLGKDTQNTIDCTKP